MWARKCIFILVVLLCSAPFPLAASKPGVGCSEGDEQREKGNIAAAAHAYERCLRESPNDPATMNNLGVSLSSLGRNEEAISVLSKAISLLPSFHVPHAALASSLSSAGRCHESHKHLVRALLLVIPPPASTSTNSPAEARAVSQKAGHSYASWLLDSIEDCVASRGPWDPHPGGQVLGAAVGHSSALAMPEIFLRAGSLLVNWGDAEAASIAARSFRAAARLGWSGDDAYFGEGMGLQVAGREQQVSQGRVWPAYLRCAARRGRRRALCLMACHMSMLRCGAWVGHSSNHADRDAASSGIGHGADLGGFGAVKEALLAEIRGSYLQGGKGIASDNAVQPHEALSLGLGVSDFMRLTSKYASSRGYPQAKLPPTDASKGKTSFRVGWASSDLGAHATSHLIKGVLAGGMGGGGTGSRPICISFGSGSESGSSEDEGWKAEISRSCEMLDVPGYVPRDEAVAAIRGMGVQVMRESLFSATQKPLFLCLKPDWSLASLNLISALACP